MTVFWGLTSIIVANIVTIISPRVIAWVTCWRAAILLPCDRAMVEVTPQPMPSMSPSPTKIIVGAHTMLTAATPSAPTPLPTKNPSAMVIKEMEIMLNSVGKKYALKSGAMRFVCNSFSVIIMCRLCFLRLGGNEDVWSGNAVFRSLKTKVILERGDLIFTRADFSIYSRAEILVFPPENTKIFARRY